MKTYNITLIVTTVLNIFISTTAFAQLTEDDCNVELNRLGLDLFGRPEGNVCRCSDQIFRDRLDFLLCLASVGLAEPVLRDDFSGQLPKSAANDEEFLSGLTWRRVNKPALLQPLVPSR